MVEKQRPRSGSRFSLNPLTAAVLDAIPPLGYKRPPPLIGHETVTNSHRLLRAKTTLTRTSTPVLRIGTLISRSVSNSSIVQQSILHSATPKRRTRKISALGDTKDYIWRITLQLNNTWWKKSLLLRLLWQSCILDILKCRSEKWTSMFVNSLQIPWKSNPTVCMKVQPAPSSPVANVNATVSSVTSPLKTGALNLSQVPTWSLEADRWAPAYLHGWLTYKDI